MIVIEDTNISGLAWCLIKETNNSHKTLVHGSNVEVDGDFFFEGAWNGKFTEKDIGNSSVVMGSGGVITKNGLLICTPSHTTEGVYSLKEKNGDLYISNSIPFLLTMSNNRLDPNYVDYENDILSISDGLKKYKKTIPTINNKINIHYYHNLLINDANEIEIQEKNKNRDFIDFKDYYEFLLKNLRIISENAMDSNRTKTKYSPIVFSSNGYDSSVCAALGKKIDCNEAVVYESKKSFKKDSGKEVVKSLGYENVIEKEELSYFKSDNAAEFVSSGELGTSIFFSSSEDELEGKFLLSGLHGDKMWDRNAKPSEDIIRSFYPDTAKKEFRLRVGFINVIIPFFGVENSKSIARISNSVEMKPWTLGTDYDRPIARRIVEEMGVPRELFGMQKKGGAGSNLRFGTLSYLEKIMPQESFLNFSKFYQKNKKMRVAQLHRHIPYFFFCGNVFLRAKKIQLIEKILKIEDWDRKYKCSPWAPSYLFLWGAEELGKNYASAKTRNFESK